MKRPFNLSRLSLLLLVVIAIVAAWQLPGVFAVGQLSIASPMNSNIAVMNQNAFVAANNFLEIRAGDGTRAHIAAQADTIGPGEAKMYYQSINGNIADDFRGSAIVYADQPAHAVGAEVIDSGGRYYNSAYDWLRQGSTTTYVPLVWQNHNGMWNTRITIQNTDASSSATATVYYYNASGGSPTTYVSSTAAMGVVVQDNGDMSVTNLGYAKISSTKPVAVVVDEYNNYQSGNPSMTGKLATYTGISSSSTKWYAPLVGKNYNSQWYSNIRLLNPGASAATVTISYKNSSATYSSNYSLAAGQALSVYQSNEAALPDGFRGSAVISASQPIVVRVAWAQAPANYFGLAAYNPASAGNGTLYFPRLYKSYGASWNSVINLMRTDADTSTTVNMTYYGGGLSSPLTVSGIALTKYLSIAQSSVSGLPTGWMGSAKVTASTGSLAGVVEIGSSSYTGDTTAVYEGFPPVADCCGNGYLPVMAKNYSAP